MEGTDLIDVTEVVSVDQCILLGVVCRCNFDETRNILDGFFCS